MHKNQKLCTWYALSVACFALVALGVFGVMHKVERVAARLETAIYRRDLSAIVDQDYALEQRVHGLEEVPTLNELTDFFVGFHDNTVEYKTQLQGFMGRRAHLLRRFAGSNVDVFDLSVLPNNAVESYALREHVVSAHHRAQAQPKQVPFSRELKFRRKDARRLSQHMFFMCTARLAVSADTPARLSASFVATSDVAGAGDYMEYRVDKATSNVTVNRIIRMANPRNFRLAIKGFSDKLVRLHKVEAYCVNFNDVRA